MSDTQRIVEGLPPFTEDPVARLWHTLEVYADQPDEDWVVVATSGYGRALGADRTGLTWGDLRAIYRHMAGTQKCHGQREVAHGKQIPCWNRVEAGKAFCRVCELLAWDILPT